MHIFFSAGEPSGDQHAASLIEELRCRQPGIQISGYGGPRMEQAGCQLLYPLTDLAVFGFVKIVPHLKQFFTLFQRAKRYFSESRPDAVVLVDFPGFNWWIARAAKAAGIRVFYYLPPQLWAWGPWRIKRVRKLVDHVLCTLPFERDWYQERGIQAELVGHPFFDAVAQRVLDRDFCERWAGNNGKIVAVLPGSRNQEVTYNWPIMIQIMRRLHARNPGAHFLVACFKDSHRDSCEAALLADSAQLPVSFYVNKTSEIIDVADCAMMVSGSVSLELLARGTPAVVMYAMGRFEHVCSRFVLTCPFISLPNLIAGEEVMPEAHFAGSPEHLIERFTGILEGWLNDKEQRDNILRTLSRLQSQVGRTGATGRAADIILERLQFSTDSRCPKAA